MEFNTGLPPAGEAGMCLETDSAPLAFYWDGSERGERRELFAEAFDKRGGCSMSNVHGWRWATLAELTAAGIPESKARGMVHRSQLPEAAADAEWGPWIEWNGGECPIPDAKAGEWQCRSVEGPNGCSQTRCDKYASKHDAIKACHVWRHAVGCWPIVAYRVKIEAKPAIAATCAPPDGAWRDWKDGDTVPSVDRIDIIRIAAGIKGTSLTQVDNVATVSQYWGVGTFVRKWRPAVAKPVIADQNRKMFDRDSSGAVSCVRERHDIDWPSFDHAAIVAAGRDYAKRQHDKRVAAAAWVERPRDHRLGNFN